MFNWTHSNQQLFRVEMSKNCPEFYLISAMFSLLFLLFQKILKYSLSLLLIILHYQVAYPEIIKQPLKKKHQNRNPLNL
jgi:hypothetical protein